MILSVRVFDQEDQMVLPGAHLIFINGDGSVNFEKEGTSTGPDGYADLHNIDEGDIVAVSFIGYEPKMIECEGGLLYLDNLDYKYFDVEMNRSTQNLGTAVIVARKKAGLSVALKRALPVVLVFVVLAVGAFFYFKSNE
jgi:hypothetical protein